MKLNQLMNVRQIFNEHAKEKLNVSLAYKIMKVLKATEEDGSFYEEKLKEIINKYGEKDENGNFVAEGNGVKIAAGNLVQCNKEVAELTDQEATLPSITFTLSELDDLKLSVQEIYALDELIKEE